jgi:hypothetical protein
MRAQREAERRYPVRVRIAVPPEGLGRQLEIMHAWLDETCGAYALARGRPARAPIKAKGIRIPAESQVLAGTPMVATCEARLAA